MLCWKLGQNLRFQNIMFDKFGSRFITLRKDRQSSVGPIPMKYVGILTHSFALAVACRPQRSTRPSTRTRHKSWSRLKPRWRIWNKRWSSCRRNCGEPCRTPASTVTTTSPTSATMAVRPSPSNGRVNISRVWGEFKTCIFCFIWSCNGARSTKFLGFGTHHIPVSFMFLLTLTVRIGLHQKRPLLLVQPTTSVPITSSTNSFWWEIFPSLSWYVLKKSVSVAANGLVSCSQGTLWLPSIFLERQQ